MAVAAPNDETTRVWLTRRALGSGGPGAASVLTIGFGLAATLWIILAAVQVAQSEVPTPIPVWIGACLSAGMLLGAIAWELAMIRRLSARQV